jgi:hypothetical protein
MRQFFGGSNSTHETMLKGTRKVIQPDGMQISTFPDGVILKEYPEVNGCVSDDIEDYFTNKDINTQTQCLFFNETSFLALVAYV